MLIRAVQKVKWNSPPNWTNSRKLYRNLTQFFPHKLLPKAPGCSVNNFAAYWGPHTYKHTRVFESEQRCVCRNLSRRQRQRHALRRARIYNRDWDQKIVTAPFLATPRFVLFEAETAAHTLTRRLLWLLLRERKWTSQTSAAVRGDANNENQNPDAHARNQVTKKAAPQPAAHFYSHEL